MKYSLHITEDHQLFADGLKSMLRDFEEIEVTGSSMNGAETLQSLNISAPDILLLDLNLPNMNGTEIIDYVKSNQLATKIIIVSMYYEKSYKSSSKASCARLCAQKCWKKSIDQYH
ncbi:MAG: response regulator transcription factor [Cytophagales bacterium]